MINFTPKTYEKIKNKYCAYCNNIVLYEEYIIGNLIYSETKRKTKIIMHKKCFERNFYGNSNNK